MCLFIITYNNTKTSSYYVASAILRSHRYSRRWFSTKRMSNEDFSVERTFFTDVPREKSFCCNSSSSSDENFLFSVTLRYDEKYIATAISIQFSCDVSSKSRIVSLFRKVYAKYLKTQVSKQKEKK